MASAGPFMVITMDQAVLDYFASKLEEAGATVLWPGEEVEITDEAREMLRKILEADEQLLDGRVVTSIHGGAFNTYRAAWDQVDLDELMSDWTDEGLIKAAYHTDGHHQFNPVLTGEARNEIRRAAIKQLELRGYRLPTTPENHGMDDEGGQA